MMESSQKKTAKRGFMEEFMAKIHRNLKSCEESKQSEKWGLPRATITGCGSNHE